jgi:hypothetical protein
MITQKFHLTLSEAVTVRQYTETDWWRSETETEKAKKKGSG